MKSHLLAASLAASSLFLLAACATDSGAEQASQRGNPCLGVAPATGTSLVRKEDCGVRPQQSAGPSSAQPTGNPKN